MNEEIDYEQNLAFGDLIESTTVSNKTVWNSKLTTQFAHPSGRIPSHSAAVGWQPIHIPGKTKTEQVYSSTVRGLVRRVRNNRGEA